MISNNLKIFIKAKKFNKQKIKNMNKNKKFLMNIRKKKK